MLRAPELLTVNLAITDIGMALSMYPLSIASAFNHAWIGGDASCLYYGLMGMIFSITSIMTLAVMGMVRYLVTGSPPKKGNPRLDYLFIYFFFRSALSSAAADFKSQCFKKINVQTVNRVKCHSGEPCDLKLRIQRWKKDSMFFFPPFLGNCDVLTRIYPIILERPSLKVLRSQSLQPVAVSSNN